MRKEKTVPFILQSPDGKKIKGYICISAGMIAIGFSGYGEHSAPKCKGTPILIEYHEDDVVHTPGELAPLVHIFEDINTDNTTTVSLAGASEKRRV